MELRKIFLANRIGDCELAGIVGDDVVVEELLALFGQVKERVRNGLRAARRRGDALDPEGRDEFIAIVLRLRLGGGPCVPEHRFVKRGLIRLIQDEDHLLWFLLGNALHPSDVLQLRLLCSIEDDAGDVGPRRRPAGHSVEQPPEFADGLMKTGRIQEDKLSTLVRGDAAHGIARRLLDRRDDRDLLADKRIDERRLARVRPSNHTHNSDFAHLQIL